MLADYEARIAALERLVGKLALENEFLKGGRGTFGSRKREHVHFCRAPGLSVAEGCRLMDSRAQHIMTNRSSSPSARACQQIKAICAEWSAYGYRRVTAELHDEGRIVNHKKVMRLMKETA